jgi:hypothetical protein
MIKTNYGIFDGDSWEEICQMCFKSKYHDEGYQYMPALPNGDFGIEGFTKSGKVFQCYCPDFEYDSKNLYENQRDKITRDLNKLKKNEKELLARLSNTKISKWYLVTPYYTDNNLIKHCRAKEKEVKAWKLSIIADDFEVGIFDANDYAIEINQMLSIKGEKLIFDEDVPEFEFIENGKKDFYSGNIERKNKFRLNSDLHEKSEKLEKLNQITINYLMTGKETLRNISTRYPKMFYQLIRIINQYETEVEELSLTLEDTPNNLISKVKTDLSSRITKETSSLSETDLNNILNHIISKWLAICQMDFE